MPDASRLRLYSRIGFLAIFNPMDPDGFYSINLARREESIVASVLVRLAYEEPGENVEDETLDGSRFETPRTWLDALPEEGVWEVRYVTPNTCGKEKEKSCKCDACVAGSCAMPAYRRKLAVNMLGWEFDDEEETVVAKWEPSSHELTSIHNWELKAAKASRIDTFLDEKTRVEETIAQIRRVSMLKADDVVK